MTNAVVKALALLVGALLLASGSAYAGASIARNSVGSAQVKNESLRHKDVRDGTLGAKELAPGAAAKPYTVIRNVPEGMTEVLDIPGFSRFTVSCSNTQISLNIAFGDADPEPSDPLQQHGLAASDITDDSPAGGATVTGFGGGVGFGSFGGSQPGAGILVRGDYWGRADKLLAHGTFAWGFPSAPCLFRLQVVVEKLRQAAPLPRRPVVGRETVCEATGTAYCSTDPQS